MNEVVVYSKPNCKNCKMLKRWLTIKGIEFSEIDVTENKDGYDKITKANRTSLPVLEINNEIVDIKEYNDILDLV